MGKARYEQPVDMDSWGMDLMEESAWLKNSATENLDGFGKVVADTAIDIGQNVALTPLLLGGPKTYIAGLAANAAAEEMYGQTAKGKSAGEAFASGALTAGAEVVKTKISKISSGEKILKMEPGEQISVKTVIDAIREDKSAFVKKLLKKADVEAKKETVQYLVDFLLDKASRNPNAEFSLQEFAASVAANKGAAFAGKGADVFFDLLEKAWKDLE